MPSLALLLHLAEGHHGPVGPEAAERAIRWCTYLEAHARRAYHPVTARRRAVAALLVAKIRAGHLRNPFVARDVTEADWSGLTDVEDVHQALEFLVDLGWLRTVSVPPGARGGRSTTRYQIHPKLLERSPAKPAKPSGAEVSRVLRVPSQAISVDDETEL